jgi:hypothetical protein
MERTDGILRLLKTSYILSFDKVQAILQKHLPASALNYCLELWYFYKFDFKLRKSRLTKIGDFTFRTGKTPRITVNQDLHPFLFLTTYIHEVAHLEVQVKLIPVSSQIDSSSETPDTGPRAAAAPGPLSTSSPGCRQWPGAPRVRLALAAFELSLSLSASGPRRSLAPGAAPKDSAVTGNETAD